MRKSGVVLVVALALSGMVALAGSGFAGAASVSVEAGNLYFCSPSFENGVCDTSVTAGDTITWASVAGFHTVTQCTEDFATCPPSGGFDSGILESGQTFSRTFETPGTYPYYCTLHPTQMRGRVIVSAAETPAPTPAPEASGTPAATGTPTASGQPATTATPGGVPRTGGMPGDGNGNILALAGGLLLATAAATFMLGRFGIRGRF